MRFGTFEIHRRFDLSSLYTVEKDIMCNMGISHSQWFFSYITFFVSFCLLRSNIPYH